MKITLINPSLTPFNYFHQKLSKNPSIPQISSLFSQKNPKKSHLYSSHTKIPQINSLPTNISSKNVTNFGARTQLAATTTLVTALSKNPTFVSGLCALLVAQCVKVALYVMVEKRWDFKFCYSSGGMPSSHSALCTGLTTAVGMCNGVESGLFAVCLGFSVIVMYDAIGVRRHAGMQAQVLNKIIEDLFQGHPISERKLKELLGHTPSQVVAGALLGIAVAWYCCRGRLAPA